MRAVNADKIKEELQYYIECAAWGDGIVAGLKTAIEVIDNTVTMDVTPTAHAHWEEIRNAYGELEGWMCSNPKCGTEAVCASDYCPHCGARMDGDGE